MMVNGEVLDMRRCGSVSAGQIPPGSQEVWMPLFNFADEISYDCNEYTSSYSTVLGGLSNTANQHNIPRYGIMLLVTEYKTISVCLRDQVCPVGLIFMFAVMICNL